MGRRHFTFMVVGPVAVALIGFVSNHFACPSIEAFIMRDNREHIVAVRRGWRMPERTVLAVPRGSVVMRTDRDTEGRLVTFPLPPNTPTPFAFAHASHFGPSVMKVRYGWADGGKRMSFGEGGEMFVLSFFGSRPLILKKRPSWYF